ncbi:MAG: phage portal protein [Planctomycetia bacterium]|nr:phage portal protein [Planctomycetia bacterium]
MSISDTSKVLEDFIHTIDLSGDFPDHSSSRPHIWNMDWLSGDGVPYHSDMELDEIRRQCRELAMVNEFAINGHENRISYIVGTGFPCRVFPKGSSHQQTCDAAQEILDDFIFRNHWYSRQQESIRRLDRDGEVFLRFSEDPDGHVQTRFVDPSTIRTPRHHHDHPEYSYGILTLPQDPETVRGYFIDEEFVPSVEIQHRRSNVDRSVKRGVPLFYPVLGNLRRAEKILRNMSVVAGVQSAIAIIRKHTNGTTSSVRQFVQNESDQSHPDISGRTYSYRRYSPGTILDTSSGIEYEFPASSIDAGSYVSILQAELRAVASRLVMPEFMLTSDASNANYSSTMVAEGPSVRTFQRLQQDLVHYDTEVFRYVIRTAIRWGRLPSDTLTRISFQCVPPGLAVRDRLAEAQADEILLRCGVLSPQTMAMRHGLDPCKEQENIRKMKNGSVN